MYSPKFDLLSCCQLFQLFVLGYGALGGKEPLPLDKPARLWTRLQQQTHATRDLQWARQNDTLLQLIQASCSQNKGSSTHGVSGSLSDAFNHLQLHAIPQEAAHISQHKTTIKTPKKVPTFPIPVIPVIPVPKTQAPGLAEPAHVLPIARSAWRFVPTLPRARLGALEKSSKLPFKRPKHLEMGDVLLCLIQYIVLLSKHEVDFCYIMECCQSYCRRCEAE